MSFTKSEPSFSQKSGKTSTPTLKKRKLDTLGQSGSMAKYFSQNSPKIMSPKASKKSSSDGLKKVIPIESESGSESSLSEDVIYPSPVKEKKRIANIATEKWKSFQQLPLKSGKSSLPTRPSGLNKDSSSLNLASEKPKRVLKTKREVVLCPDSPNISNIEPPPNLMTAEDLKISRSEKRVLSFDKSKQSPLKKLKVRTKETSNSQNIRKSIVYCPESCESSSESHCSSKSKKGDMFNDMLSQSPPKKRKLCGKDVKLSTSSQKCKIENCPELPAVSSNYRRILKNEKSSKTELRRKMSATSTSSASSLTSSQPSNSSVKMVIVPESPAKKLPENIKKDTSKSGKVSKPAANSRLEPMQMPKSILVKSRPVAVVSLAVTEPTAPVNRVVRHSQKNVSENDLLSLPSSTKVDKSVTILPEETRSAAAVAFGQSCGSILSAVEMKTPNQICPDFDWAVSNRRRMLNSSFKCNYQFHMRLNEDAQAIRLLSIRVGRQCYPNGEIVHNILTNIIPNATDRVTLHRSLDLLYRILAFHPAGAGSGAMRQYYWSFMSQRFDDKEPCSRWEHLRTLLEALLQDEQWSSDDVDGQSLPTETEAKNHTATYLIQILSDDFKNWIDGAKQPSPLLHDKKNLPLVAQLLWPQGMNGYVNGTCRELMRLHLAALGKKNRDLQTHTGQLVKMMASLTQLCDMQIPLKMRAVGEQMSHLGREMADIVHDVCGSSTTPSVTYDAALQTVASTQLRLVLATLLLNRLDPRIPVMEGQQITLASMVESYLLDPQETNAAGICQLIDRDVAVHSVARFRARPAAIRWCTAMAIASYMRCYCTDKTWYFIRDKRRNPVIQVRTLHRDSPDNVALPSSPASDIFSTSFSFDSLMADLRAAKLLLQENREKKSVYSLMFTP